MKPLRLLVLAVVAFALVVLAVWSGRLASPLTEGPGHGLLWPGLREELDDVDRIALYTAGDHLQEALVREAGTWRVQGREGWYADAGRVQALLRELAGARKLEAKTAREDNHALLGLASIDAADATGTLVAVRRIRNEGRLLVGNPNPHSPGRFVRFHDERQTWLVDAELDLPADPRAWLDRALVDIAARRVARLDITSEDGRSVIVVRTPGEDPGHTLAGADDTVDEARVETAATLFEGLRLDDVARDAGDDPDTLDAAILLRLETTDGLVLSGQSWRAGPVRWVRFGVEFDVESARGWVDAEIESDTAALEAARQPAADGGQAAAAPLDPETAGMAPLDAALRLETLHTQAQDLRERLEGWAFSLSPRKQEIIEAGYDAYLVPID